MVYLAVKNTLGKRNDLRSGGSLMDELSDIENPLPFFSIPENRAKWKASSDSSPQYLKYFTVPQLASSRFGNDSR